jgi:hypothetical protein
MLVLAKLPAASRLAEVAPPLWPVPWWALAWSRSDPTVVPRFGLAWLPKGSEHDPILRWVCTSLSGRSSCEKNILYIYMCVCVPQCVYFYPTGTSWVTSPWQSCGGGLAHQVVDFMWPTCIPNKTRLANQFHTRTRGKVVQNARLGIARFSWDIYLILNTFGRLVIWLRHNSWSHEQSARFSVLPAKLTISTSIGKDS